MVNWTWSPATHIRGNGNKAPSFYCPPPLTLPFGGCGIHSLTQTHPTLPCQLSLKENDWMIMTQGVSFFTLKKLKHVWHSQTRPYDSSMAADMWTNPLRGYLKEKTSTLCPHLCKGTDEMKEGGDGKKPKGHLELHMFQHELKNILLHTKECFIHWNWICFFFTNTQLHIHVDAP